MRNYEEIVRESYDMLKKEVIWNMTKYEYSSGSRIIDFDVYHAND